MSFFTKILLHFKIVEQWSVWVFKISVHNYCRAQSCCLLFTPESQTNLKRDFWRFSDPNKAGPTWIWLLKGSSSQFFQYLQWLGFCWFQRVLLAKISLNTHSRIWTQPENIAASVLFCRCVSLWIDKFTFIFKGQTMNFLPPQQRFQCSQWISSGEHLAVNSSRTVTFWLPVVKGKNTMRDVAYGKLKELTKQSLSLSF